MPFPNSLDSFTANVDNVDVIYASDVNELQTAITGLEAKVGVDSSAVTTSHDYKLGEILTTDKAVGKTATQTVDNKTLGTGTKVAIGSDADKDMYYRASDGTLTRIPVGTDNQILKLNGTTPGWEAETTTVNASTTAAGIVEEATLAENEAGTATGATGARLFVNPSTMPSNFFGDGSDGDVTISGNTTLTRDMFYNNLTINTGVTLTTANYRIFVKDTLTNNNATTGIVNNGGNGSGVNGGSVASGSLIAGASGGAGATNSTSYGGGGGGGGGTVWIFAKTITTQGGIKALGGNGANGLYSGGSAGNFAGSAGTASTKTLITANTGGAGGQGSVSALGGAGGVRTLSTMSTHNLLTMSFYIDTVSMVGLTSGTGGGGGGYDNASGGGGGGGGQGGVILCVYKTLTTSGTLSVAGGTGGSAGGSGTAGTAGGAGSTFSLQIV